MVKRIRGESRRKAFGYLVGYRFIVGEEASETTSGLNIKQVLFPLVGQWESNREVELASRPQLILPLWIFKKDQMLFNLTIRFNFEE